MAVKQVSVFIENKEGRIKKAINALSEAGINIRALSIADASKYGILRMIVSDNDKAIKSLEDNDFIVRESDVLIVEVPDKVNGLNSILEIVADRKINLEYVYAFVSTKIDHAIVVMRFEDIEEAEKALKEGNATLLEKEDIAKL